MSHDCHLVAPARNSSLFTTSTVGAAVLWRPLLIVPWRIVDCFSPRMTGSAFLNYGRVQCFATLSCFWSPNRSVYHRSSSTAGGDKHRGAVRGAEAIQQRRWQDQHHGQRPGVYLPQGRAAAPLGGPLKRATLYLININNQLAFAAFSFANLLVFWVSYTYIFIIWIARNRLYYNI